MNVFITYHLKSQLILFVIQIINFGLFFQEHLTGALKVIFLDRPEFQNRNFMSLWSKIDDFNDSDDTGM